MRRSALLLLAQPVIGTAVMGDQEADVEELLNQSVVFAEQMLQQHGEFHPYGAAMKPGGELVGVSVDDGDERPASDELVAMLQDGLREGAAAGAYVATATVYDVEVEVPGTSDLCDAIAVELDHRDDYSVVVVLPYRLDDGEVVYGETLAQPGSNRIFGP